METFVAVVMVLMVLALCAIGGWVVKKNAESDERYERELDRIYGRKR